MNHSKLKIALASAALAVSGAAMADQPSWTFVGLKGGLAESPSDGEETGNYRFGIEGSVALFNIMHLSGEYTAGNVEAEDGNGVEIIDSDLDVWEIALGSHVSVSDNADLYLEGIFGNVDLDDLDDSDIYGGAVGARVMLTDRAEINVGVEALEVDETSSQEISPFAGGRYSFTDLFSVGVEAKVDNARYLGENSLDVDVRFSFGDQSWLGNN
ncbi:MAG: outer membrane beta-barrel protein [Gammaproteobacteria bacterium]